MGIQSFVPSSGGGMPGQEFINQVIMDSPTRTWAQGGSAGNYVLSSSNNGYVYFVGATTVGGALNQIISVPSSFTSIKIIGITKDLISLYKVASKSTTSFSTTPIYTRVTSTQNLAIASNKSGIVDALIVAGGGGRSQHGGGGGAGGLVIINTFPLNPGESYPFVIGAAGSNDTVGGSSIFAGIKANGGAQGNSGGTPGASGGSGAGGGSESFAAGAATQLSGANAASAPFLFFSGYGQFATATGYGHPGASGQGSASHDGGGGGGAGGPGSGRNGGAGLALTEWDSGVSTYYSAGGHGSRHSGNINGAAGTGWSSSGHGMGGCTYGSGYNGASATGGIVIVRSYDI